MASKMTSPRYLCLLFNRSTNFHQIFTKNIEIYFQLIGICYNFHMAENKMVSRMASTQIFVLVISLQPFNRFLRNFHQKITSIWQIAKWHPQWHPPRYLCLLQPISSKVQPIFIKFSPKFLKYIFNLQESAMMSIFQTYRNPSVGKL